MQINYPSGAADRLKKEEQKNAITYPKARIRWKNNSQGITYNLLLCHENKGDSGV
jgi:hypothetical protein